MEYNLPREYLSYSQISTYMNCPQQYKRTYIDGLRREGSVALHVGSVVHFVIDAFFKNKIEGTEQSLEEGIDILHNYMESLRDVEHKIKKENFNDIFNKCSRVYEKFFSSPLIQTLNPIKAEEPIEHNFGGIPFRGIVDLINKRDDGTLEIIDFKVTGRHKNNNDAIASLQLSLYAAVTEIYNVGFVCLTRPNTNTSPVKISKVTATRTQDDILHAVNIVKGVAESISAGNFYRCSPETWICSKKWCPAYSQCRENPLVY